jgi:hypothetical protein
MPRRLHIEPQPQLSVKRQLEIAANGVQHRLLRSSLTLGVVTLAVAFLTNVLVEHNISQSCKRGLRQLSAQQRELSEFGALVDNRFAGDDLAERLAGLPPDRWQLAALAGWLGNREQATALRDDCADLVRCRDWFDSLRIGQRRQLVGKRSRVEAMAGLANAAERERFAKAARDIPLRLPDGFLEFAAREHDVRQQLAAAEQAMAEHRTRWQAATDGQTFSAWLVDAFADTARRDALLAEHRLLIPGDAMHELTNQAHVQRDALALRRALAVPGIGAAYSKAFSGLFERDSVISRMGEDSELASWVGLQMADNGANADTAALQATAAGIVRDREIASAESRLLAAYGESDGLSANTFWLLVVSLLVCIAGITNAMLVSVIERFREIATMKCLGALDGFIARLFLIESAFLGGVGGVLGVLLGTLIGVGRMLASYSDWVTTFFPWTGLLQTAAICVCCGLGLATISALYPAFSAARMPPMAAMRVE